MSAPAGDHPRGAPTPARGPEVTEATWEIRNLDRGCTIEVGLSGTFDELDWDRFQEHVARLIRHRQPASVRLDLRGISAGSAPALPWEPLEEAAAEFGGAFAVSPAPRPRP